MHVKGDALKDTANFLTLLSDNKFKTQTIYSHNYSQVLSCDELRITKTVDTESTDTESHRISASQ